MTNGLRRVWNAPGVKLAVVVFLVSRIILSVNMVVIRQVYPEPLPPDPISRPYLGVEATESVILEPWQRWDTLHYQAIAERGYQAFDTALFVPPLYPWLMRFAGTLVGGNSLLGGILVSNIAYLLGLVAFFRYALVETRENPVAQRSLIYLASFPVAFFFLAAYTESLFLLAVSLALTMTLQKRWHAAGLWGCVAALSRLTGALIAVPLAFGAFSAWKSTRDWKPWVAVVYTGIGAAFFPLYTWLVLGEPPWTPIVVQAGRFHGGMTFPGLNLLHAIERIAQGGALMADYFDFAFILLFLFLAIPVWRHLSRVSAVYYLSYLGLYLIREAGVQPLLATSRYVLVFMPAFIILGKAGRDPRLQRLILYPSWMLLLLLSGQFAIWGWVG